jgi:hypothetical protein
MPNGRTKKNGTVATGAKSDRAAILGLKAKQRRDDLKWLQHGL